MFKVTKIIKGFRARKAEQGNVLFLILIAVALFAALSYAVTQSSRTGGGAADGESNLVNSAQITQYPASVRTAIVRMQINGIEAAQLNFDRPNVFDTAVTGCDLAPGPCVFHPQGGGATSVTAPPEVMMDGLQGDWIFTGNYGIVDVGTTAATSAANDVIAFLPGVRQSLCQRINVELGVPFATDPDGDGVGTAVATVLPVVAEEMNTVNGIDIPNGALTNAQTDNRQLGGDFAGQPFGCADFVGGTADPTDADLVYYHVLLER